jgi:hypothetical protein
MIINENLKSQEIKLWMSCGYLIEENLKEKGKFGKMGGENG